MANAVYDQARQGFLAGEIDWDTAVIKVALVRGYTPAPTTHKFVSDVTTASGVIQGTPQTLAGKTTTGGVGDANDITFTAVAANASAHGLLIYQASAVGGGADVAATAQRVIMWIDSVTATPNNGDITVTWNAAGIISI